MNVHSYTKDNHEMVMASIEDRKTIVTLNSMSSSALYPWLVCIPVTGSPFLSTEVLIAVQNLEPLEFPLVSVGR